MVVMFHFVHQTLSKQKKQVRERKSSVETKREILLQAVRHEHTPLCKNVYVTYSKSMQYVSVHVFTQT